METLEAIFTRRSIRQYKDKKVPGNIVKEIIQAAMAAPSAYNYQPWHYLVIDSKKMMDETLKAIPHAEMLKQTPLAILVCGDKELENNINFIVEDCSAATQNALLASHALGLGAVWVGIYPVPEIIEAVKKLFNLPPNIIPISLISMGYANEKLEQEDRYKPERIHYNKW